MKRILMMSHGITGVTGFANQLWLQSRALLETGEYEVYVIHRDYRGEPFFVEPGSCMKLDSKRNIDGLHILPVGTQQWGEDVWPQYINKYKPDYVHTLGDIWCYQFLKEIPHKHPWNWLGHYVFDTENMVGFWNNSLMNVDIAVVPSKISLELCKSYGHENVRYVPHGIDTNTYKPCTEEEKIKYREDLGIPEEAFVIGMVAHNQHRKKVNRLIRAFEIISKQIPESMLVLHCLPRDSTGWDLAQILKDKRLLHRTFFTNKAAKGTGDVHVPETELRKLYCSMDVHIVPTGGEGFGVPLVESLACGIPTAATAYTSPKEFFCDEVEENGKRMLKNVRGFAVPYIDVDEHQTGGLWASIDVPKLAETMKFIYDNRAESRAMAMRGRKFVVDNYDNEVVKKQWVELYKNYDNILSDIRATRKEEGLKVSRLMPNV